MAIVTSGQTAFELGGTFTLPIPIVFGFGDLFDVPLLPIVITSEAGYETSQELTLPAGAAVTAAVFTVAGHAPPLEVNVGKIATVRAAAGSPTSSSKELVIDFGVLRTVSSVRAPVAISSITAWRGTRFDQSVPTPGAAAAQRVFTEVQTERLLVDLVSSVSPDDLARQATVTTATPPADLELLVAGTRAWARPGPTPEGLSEDVDVTAALQEALDRATPGSDGNVHIAVTLRARVPGQLALSLAQPLGYLRTHTVVFPGPTTHAFAEEGELTVPLPLPAGANAWIIHRVLATITATDDDPQRVLPPVGPDPSSHAEVVLDPDRRIVVHVPAARFAPFERLVGVRVAVQPQPGGVELTGAMLADDDDAPEGSPLPGDPLPNATFTPLTLDAGDEPAFVTLALPRPLKLVAGADLWFSLAATRGSTLVGLAAGGDPADVATLRRVMPNGVVRPLSSPAGVRTDALRLRIVGLAPETAPIDIVDVDLAGGPIVREPVADPAVAATGLVPLALHPPAARPELALQLTATAATKVTIGPVVVAYVEPSTGGSP
jgi:hypothetical protein